MSYDGETEWLFEYPDGDYNSEGLITASEKGIMWDGWKLIATWEEIDKARQLIKEARE